MDGSHNTIVIAGLSSNWEAWPLPLSPPSSGGAQVGLRPQIPTFDRVIIDEGADSEKIAPRRKSMEQIKLQVEFLKRLYLLKETVNSIAEGAEFWTKEEGTSLFRSITG